MYTKMGSITEVRVRLGVPRPPDGLSVGVALAPAMRATLASAEQLLAAPVRD